MSLEERLAELDDVGAGDDLAKAVRILSEQLVKGDSFIAPVTAVTPANTFKKTEPSVTKAPKAHSSMGGSPEAKRGTSEGSEDGPEGWDVPGESEGPEGGERIKKQRNKGKSKVPSDLDRLMQMLRRSMNDACEHSLQKSVCPTCGNDDGYDDDGDADDEGMGSDPPMADQGDEGGEGYAPPVDGDEESSPALMKLQMFLQQNPDVAEVLLGAAEGAGADDGSGYEDGEEQGGPPAGPPPAAGGASAPPPGAEEEEDPRLRRSIQRRGEALEKAMASDPNRDVMAEAIEASPALEAFMDHVIGAAAITQGQLDKVTHLVKSMNARIAAVESMQKSMAQVTVELAKSMTAEAEPLNKGMAAAPPAPRLQDISPGVLFSGDLSKGMHNPDRAVGIVDRDVLRKSIKSVMDKRGPDAKSASKLLSKVPFGDPAELLRVAPSSVFEAYQAFVAAP